MRRTAPPTSRAHTLISSADHSASSQKCQPGRTPESEAGAAAVCAPPPSPHRSSCGTLRASATSTRSDPSSAAALSARRARPRCPSLAPGTRVGKDEAGASSASIAGAGGNTNTACGSGGRFLGGSSGGRGVASMMPAGIVYGGRLTLQSLRDATGAPAGSCEQLATGNRSAMRSLSATQWGACIFGPSPPPARDRNSVICGPGRGLGRRRGGAGLVGGWGLCSLHPPPRALHGRTHALFLKYWCTLYLTAVPVKGSCVNVEVGCCCCFGCCRCCFCCLRPDVNGGRVCALPT